MNKVHTLKVNLPLKKKFVIAGGEAEIKVNLVTVLNNRYSGEASGSVAYGPSLEVIEKAINEGIARLSKYEEIDESTLEAINDFDIHPIARSALIGMVLNYLSGESRRYPWEILSLGSPVGIQSSITIGLDHPEAMVEAIKQSPYPIVKVKLGNDNDQQIIEALGEINDKVIRVDANGAWSCEKAEEMIHFLHQAGITLIEQPTSFEFVKDWPSLKGKAEQVELIVDEGLNSLKDYHEVTEYVDGINIKMEKAGGILEAAKIARAARKDKRKVMLGCMVESSIGIAQSVYMSALADYYDLDGPQLIEADIATGIRYNNESIEVDREIIGGPKLKREIVDRYISE